jgi:hypothetical protein
MKFIVKDEKVSVEDEKNLNSSTINYYEAEVEFDEAWNELTIEARIVKKENGMISDIGTAIAVIDNKIFIDKDVCGTYGIGFVGYTIEDEVKTFQISSNLIGIYFDKGAGEIEVSNSTEVPEPTEWEQYLSQVQEFINTANTKINQANNLDVSVTKEGKTATVTVTKKDNTTQSVEIDDGADGISTVVYYDTEEADTLVIETIQNAEEVSY